MGVLVLRNLFRSLVALAFSSSVDSNAMSSESWGETVSYTGLSSEMYGLFVPSSRKVLRLTRDGPATALLLVGDFFLGFFEGLSVGAGHCLGLLRTLPLPLVRGRPWPGESSSPS